MRRGCGQSGMSLMEVLVTLATVLILISALIGVGRYVKARADIDLTRATLETLSTALAVYYDDFGAFPFDTDTDDDDILDDYFAADLVNDISVYSGLMVTLNTAVLLEKDGNNSDVSTASSAALFYFLDKNPSSRDIVDGVSSTLVSNKGADGITPVKITIGGTEYDLPRYIDPWGMSIRYEYLPGTAFPTLTSAGPDKIFDTPDDITSK
ncbi:MAG: type II secretion system protein [Planctomycetota bacterium]